jgi:hypothetical protein
MSTKGRGKLTTAGAFALAIAIIGCNTADPERNQTTASTSSPADSAAGKENSSMTLTGCLQQAEDGDDFILTQVNQQPGPVATSGENESSQVQQKQREAAAKSYRLSGNTDNLREMVGHEVRVTGTIEDRGEAQSREGGDIEQGDLARLEVTAAQSVSGTCGSGESPQRPRQ